MEFRARRRQANQEQAKQALTVAVIIQLAPIGRAKFQCCITFNFGPFLYKNKGGLFGLIDQRRHKAALHFPQFSSAVESAQKLV